MSRKDNMSLSVLILAAGKGSRMNSQHPKVLHEVGNVPMIYYPINLAKSIKAQRISVVVGKNSSQLRKSIKGFQAEVEILEQSEQLGTGHAVLCTKNHFAHQSGDLLILYGDCPLISDESIKKLIELRKNGADLAVLGFHSVNPRNYGRLILDVTGDLEKIVEATDATTEEQAIKFCNSGIMIADTNLFFSFLEKVSNKNASGEFYLTDLVTLVRQENMVVQTASCPENEAHGVNDRLDLAKVEECFQNLKRAEVMRKGTTLIDPSTVYFSYDTELGADTVVEPNIIFGPAVRVRENVRIRSFSYLEGCLVKPDVIIGPFARIRPETTLDEGVRVGNFVEIKKSKLNKNVKANHLAYIGDASIGAQTNVGAGTIFCNYDGTSKNSIEVGENSFIGSNVSLVAPLKIGDKVIIGAGSTITDNVSKETLALGRSRQINKPKK